MQPISEPDTAPAMGENASFKKKPRKGTTSCGECKKRKTRCSFASPQDAICVGCQRRGTFCRSQELDDEVTVGDDGLSVRARLIRVEMLLSKMMGKVMPDENYPKGSPLADTLRGVAMNTPESDTSVNGSDTTYHPTESENCTLGKGTQILLPILDSSSSSNSIGSNRGGSYVVSALAADNYALMRQALHDALPSQEVAEALISRGRILAYLQIICNLETEIFKKGNLQSLAYMAKLPPVTSHPVLIARKLLQLALAIQQGHSDINESSIVIPEPLDTSMKKYIDIATSMVTTNEKLIYSVEAIECLILEGSYHINSGNLRRAWICFRRAMSFAQFTGLHKATTGNLKYLDSNTKISPAVMWLRIIYGERYLSLILGVPSAVSSNGLATEQELRKSTPTDHMSMVQAIICQDIMQRNEKDDYTDFTTTSKIDFDLQKAAKSIDPKWWQLPKFNSNMSMLELMQGMLRMHAQINHHNILILLHLPFMLRDSSERRYDYSKTVCTYSSGEILTRWKEFRAFVTTVYCCRWVDFAAFTAALTLLLAHIDAHSNFAEDQMRHRRLVDRALIEKCMETMDVLNKANGDLLTKQTAEFVRKLLAVELDAATAKNIYNAQVTAEGDADHAVQKDSDSLQLKIPYFGTVNITHQRRYVPQHSASPPAQHRLHSQLQPQHHTATNLQSNTSNIYPFSFSTPFVPTSSSIGTDLHTATPTTDYQMGNHFLQTQYSLDPLVTFEPELDNQFMGMPDLMATDDEWSFQGVDSMFFESIMKGNTANLAGNGNRDPNWGEWSGH